MYCFRVQQQQTLWDDDLPGYSDDQPLREPSRHYSPVSFLSHTISRVILVLPERPSRSGPSGSLGILQVRSLRFFGQIQ
jgi:hypothetical protein